MSMPPIVSPEEWRAAREKLLVEEKEYRFEGPDGPASLLDLFEGRRQLIVYRAFYEPGITTTAEGTSYPERACAGCSFIADQIGHPAHLNARDTTLVFASRA